jgi:nucleoside 2-deoxyribosyltransferase
MSRYARQCEGIISMSTAFVLMPFDNESDSVYSMLIEPALISADFEACRADTTLDQQNVMRDVIQGIESADLVIADISGLNGNVMYELGIAHGLGRPTLMITRSLEEVPFDLKSYRVIEYSTHFEDAESLKSKLRDVASTHSRGEVNFGSPVSDFSQPELRQAATGQDGPALSIEPSREEPTRDLLDDLQVFNDNSTVFNSTMNTISAETGSVGEQLEELTARVERLNQDEHGAASARQLRTIAIKGAAILDEYATRLDELLPELEESSSRLVEAGINYAEWLRINGEPDQIAETREASEDLLATVRPALENIADFRESTLSLRGLSGPLTRAATRVGKYIDRIINTGETMESYADRTLSVLVDAG